MDEIIRRLVSQRQRLVGEERKLCDTGVSTAKYQDREELINLLDDVLVLLKAQEPMVITVDEFRQYGGETMWLETKNNELQQITMEGIAFVLMAAEINRWNGCGSYWRCWNKRPTDEQRKAVKWDD